MLADVHTASREARLQEAKKPQTRELRIRKDAIDVEARTCEVAFASEEPYDRWWGTEVLDMSPQSVRLGRLNDSAAVLWNHDADCQVGVVMRAKCDSDRVGRAVLRFGRSEDAEELWQDVQDGIVTKVSVGYMIHELMLESSTDTQDTYRVTDWEPYEISFVSIPADPTVGLGRAHVPTPPVPELSSEEKTMTASAAAAVIEPQAPIDPKVEIRAGIAAERSRIAEIEAVGDAFRALIPEVGEMVRAARNNDISSDAFRVQVMDEMVKRGHARVAGSPDIGMSKQEIKQYSIVRFLNALANPASREAQNDAGFELECHRAALEANGPDRAKLGFRGELGRIPSDVLTAKRDLTVGTNSAGGYTVQTDLLAASFIDLLLNATALNQLGVTILRDLNGNIAIPRQTGGATTYWVAENSAPTESQQTFDQVTLSPKTIGAFTDMSRRLLLQSSISVENFVRQDLARQLAIGIDLAGINGSGASNQPKGVINQSGIGSVAGGTNGAAPTWDNIVDLETQVAVANAATGTLKYLTNAKARGKLKRTAVLANTANIPIWAGNEVNGYPAVMSNQVPANLTKGTASGICSAILFGDWSSLIWGMWGGLDVLVDPYTGGTAGTVRVVTLQDLDFNVRHPESFAAMLDALTT